MEDYIKDDIKEKVLEVLNDKDKDNFKDAKYKQGFEDCLDIICKVFDLKE